MAIKAAAALLMLAACCSVQAVHLDFKSGKLDGWEHSSESKWVGRLKVSTPKGLPHPALEVGAMPRPNRQWRGRRCGHVGGPGF